MDAALAVIGTLVADVRDVRIEVPTDRTVQAAESFAYHAENVARTPELYQPETLRRIRSGEKISAAEYIQRRRELDLERRRARDFFADVDLLVTPTMPIPAPAIADLRKDPEALRPAELVLLRNTRPFNVWGLPAYFRALRIYEKRAAYWIADRGAALAGGFGAEAGSCL